MEYKKDKIERILRLSLTALEVFEKQFTDNEAGGRLLPQLIQDVKSLLIEIRDEDTDFINKDKLSESLAEIWFEEFVQEKSPKGLYDLDIEEGGVRTFISDE